MSDVADAADVRVAIFFGEAETLREMGADNVAVKRFEIAAVRSRTSR